jgi:hypothetical protein
MGAFQRSRADLDHVAGLADFLRRCRVFATATPSSLQAADQSLLAFIEGNRKRSINTCPATKWSRPRCQTFRSSARLVIFGIKVMLECDVIARAMTSIGESGK